VTLEDEHVRAADRLAEATVDLAVGELRDVDLPQIHPQALRDLDCKLAVTSTRDQMQPLLRDQLQLQCGSLSP